MARPPACGFAMSYRRRKLTRSTAEPASHHSAWAGDERATTRWWWVRHAPVPDGGRIYGQSDVDCDCSAGHVFEAVAAALPADATWISSHLARTHQTAAALAAAAGIAIDPIRVPDLAEQHLGDWQGQDRAAFWAARIFQHDHWFGLASERPPGGESFADVCDRVRASIIDLTLRHRGRDIVAVSHGGPIRAALGVALGLDPEVALAFTVDNCSLTRLDQLGGDPARRWRVITVNHRPWREAPSRTGPLG